MMIEPEELNRIAKKVEKESARFYKRLKRRPPAGIDDEVVELDEEVFKTIDCTKCANCCKTISPVFKERDITRLAAHFKIRPAIFTDRYLYMDNDGDYVLKSSPCPFLSETNLCNIYDIRPAACRSYPHTATLPVRKSWDLIIKNSSVCPAVFEITERLKRKYDRE